MLDNLWGFFKSNREAVSALGAGLAVVIGGGWALFNRLAPKDDKPTHRNVSANNGGVAIGGDAQNSPISTGSSAQPKR